MEIRRSSVGMIQKTLLNAFSFGVNRCNSLSTSFSIKGAVNCDELKSAIRKVMDNHESFRAGFLCEGGKFFYVVYDEFRSSIVMENAEGNTDDEKYAYVLNRIDAEMAAAVDPFVSELSKVMIYRINDEYHIITFLMNHLISDGFSLSVLAQELISNFVYGADLEAEEISYCDYCNEVAEYMKSDEGKKSKEFWIKNLNRLNIRILPEASGENLKKVSRNKERIILGPDIKNKINEYIKKNGLSEFMVLEAAYQLTIARMLNSDLTGVSVNIANRDQVRVKNCVGLYALSYLSISEYYEGQTIVDYMHSRREIHAEYNKKILGFDALEVNKSDENDNNSVAPHLFSYLNYGNDTFMTDTSVGEYKIKIVVPEKDVYYPKTFFIIGISTGDSVVLEITFDHNYFTNEYTNDFINSYTEIITNLVEEKYTTVQELIDGE